MKYRIKRFKNLAAALKELEPFIRDGEHLQTGKPFAQLGGMRSHEALANWLICVAINSEHGDDRLSFTSDPIGGDGVIYDSKQDITWGTEHIMVPRPPPGVAAKVLDTESGILDAIRQKNSKGGKAYASGKQLVVFMNATGTPWKPNRVSKRLPTPLYFEDVWVLALQSIEDGDYIYAVTRLNGIDGNAPIWQVRITADFGCWDVIRLQ